MNPKHDKRAAHLALLAQVLEYSVTDKEREAFEEMREQIQTGRFMGITERQENWVRKVLETHLPSYENAWSSGLVPRGAEVETPKALQNRPLRPPHRRHEVS